MLKIFKTRIRDVLPLRYQVPAKYWYCSASRTLEPEMRLLASFVSPNDLVIDVGGNRGIYAYAFWKLGARVEVFEPNPLCSNILRNWAVDKPLVNVHSVALSNQCGTAILHVPLDGFGVEHDASASLEYKDFSTAREISVQKSSLDSYQFGGVNFIKIDVEGHEHSVIEGASRTISTFQPALLIEIEQRHLAISIQEAFTQITCLGYKGYFLDGGKLKRIDDFDLSIHQRISDLGGKKGQYTNNFLFLSAARLAKGEYDLLMRKVGKQ